jgi:putative ABC transport system permease protein
MFHDEFRQAVRALRARPRFAAAIVAITALAIGANAAVFALVNAVLVSPLPFPEPSRLVEVSGRRASVDRDPISLPDYLDLRDRARTFDGLAATFQWSANVTGGTAERLQGMRASANFFTVLGVGASLGRTLLPDDEHGSGRPVVVLSHGFWVRRFGGDRAAVGTTVVLNGDAYTIVGVMPVAFITPIRQADVIAPFPMDTDPRRSARDVGFLRLIGRLRTGVTHAAATEDLQSIVERLRAEYPSTNATHRGVVITEWHRTLVAASRPLLVLLQAAVGLVLAVACANLANLYLVSTLRRERELAVRSALGASRSRLATEVFIESGLLAMAGCAGGMLLGGLARSALIVLAPGDLPAVAAGAAIDRRVFAAAVLAAVVVTVALAAVPVWRLTTGTLGAQLRDGSRSAGSASGRTARRWLVGVEIALASALVTLAVLLSQSFARLQAVNPGFRADHLLTVRLSLPRGTYTGRADVVRFTDTLRARLLALPGVVDVAAANVVPLNGYRATADIWPADRPEPPPAERPEAHYRMVSPSHLATFGVPLLEGRPIDAHDLSASEPVVLVNETLATRFWMGRSPIGEYLLVRDTGDTTARRARIAGVVGNVKHFGLDAEFTPDVYVPIPQVPEGTIPWLMNNFYWGVRTAHEPASVREAVRREIQALDPDVPASLMRTMNEVMDAAVAPRRVNLMLVRVFGLAALALAAAGIYAVTAFSVSTRTREIGIRAALGARPAQNLGVIVADAMRPLAAGLAAGVLLAVTGAPALRSVLFHVDPIAPITMAAVSALLLGVGLAAALIAARRVKSIDPIIALRAE